MKIKILIIVCFSLVFSCKKEKKMPENFDYGRIQDTVYYNQFFKFEIPFYAHWNLQNKQEMEEVYGVGKEYLLDGNEDFKKILDVNDVNIAQLFMLFKYDLSSLDYNEFNPSILINCENSNSFPGIATEEDYLTQAIKLLEKANLDYEISEHTKAFIDGVNFVKLNMKSVDFEINQEYYVSIINGFALGIIISYTNEDDKKKIHQLLDKIDFKD